MEEAREAKMLLLLSLFAAFLVFGMAYSFSGGAYLYYSLAAALIAGAGTYQVARSQRHERVR